MREYDLVIIGAGSGNMILTKEFDGYRRAIIEPDRFGGTCLNRGCIPSKMLVVAADAANSIRTSGRLGVHGSIDRIDWKAIRERVFGRLDPLHDSAVHYRRSHGVDVYQEPATFVGERLLQVGSEQVRAEAMVVAAGSRPVVPAIPGLDGVPFHTSDTIMRIDEVPASMVIVGGGFIAAEMGHVFGSLGSDVTIVQRGPRLLMGEDEAVSTRFTELAGQRYQVLLDSEVTSVARAGAQIAVTVNQSTTIATDCLLVCTGRTPNTDLLEVGAGGLAMDVHGHLVTDDFGRTSVPGVWALGDAANHFQLKHMANAEARAIRHNLLHGEDLRPLPTGLAPHAVFTDPQIARVGLTEKQARDQGLDVAVAVKPYSDTAYGWALEDTTSFVKVVAERATGRILGAHLIGPQAATLIQPLIQAIALGNTAHQVATQVIYIHPALTEAVEQALLEL